MAGANGLEVAGKLLEMLPDIGIILLTMYTESNYLERCLEIGCKGYLLTQHGISPKMGKNKLSKLEIEVLCLIAEGLSSKGIADHLFISVRTVDTHRSNILHKLELSNTVQLVRFAIKNRLVDIP